MAERVAAAGGVIDKDRAPGVENREFIVPLGEVLCTWMIWMKQKCLFRLIFLVSNKKTLFYIEWIIFLLPFVICLIRQTILINNFYSRLP